MATILSSETTGTITRVIVSVPEISDATMLEAEALAQADTGMDPIDLIACPESTTIEVHLLEG